MRLRFWIGIVICAGITACATPPPSKPPAKPEEPVVRAYPVEDQPIPEPERIEAAPSGKPQPGPSSLLGKSRKGVPVYLSDFYGKVVLVNYWASWCPPCWTEMPELETIYADYRRRGVEVVAVNHGEDNAAIVSFLDRQSRPLTFTIVLDQSGILGRARGVTGIPTTLLVDPQGKISQRYTGLFGFDPQRLRDDLDRLLKSGG